jgi:hypothetical protein
MKEWENKIAATRKLDNTYVVITDKFAYLCKKTKGRYFIKSGDNLEVKHYNEVIKV